MSDKLTIVGVGVLSEEVSMTKLRAEVKCPSCSRKVTIRVEEMVPGRSRRCPACDTVFKFSGDDGRRVQKALDDLERTLRDL